jgi:hypothetical protein
MPLKRLEGRLEPPCPVSREPAQELALGRRRRLFGATGRGLSGVGGLDDIPPPVGGVLPAPHQFLPLQGIDQPDHGRAVDAHPPRDLALRLRRPGGDVPQHRRLGPADPERLQRRGGDLRVAQVRVLEQVTESRHPAILGIAWLSVELTISRGE